MTTLHVIASSPFTDDSLTSCLRLLGPQDGLILCGEAVNALRLGSAPAEQLQRADLQDRLFALDEDLQARGLSTTLARSVDYAEFVELTMRYAKVNSWL